MKIRKESVARRVAERHREIAQYAHDTAEELSPVDTGDFQRAWETVGGGSTGPVLRGTRTGDAVVLGEQVPEVEPFTVTQLINRDPAGPKIENGWSDKAPLGVLAITAERVRAFVRRG